MLSEQNRFKLVAGFISITALFIAGGVFIVNMPGQQMEAGQWVTHTEQVINQLETLSLHVIAAEANQRGFMLTGDSEYLSPYNKAVADIKKDIDRFQELTADNPRQQDRIPALQKSADSLTYSLKEGLAQRKPVNEADLPADATGKKDEALALQIEQQIKYMKAEENRLLQLRLHEWQDDAGEAREMFILGEALLYLLVCVTGGMVLNMATQRKKLFDAEQEAAALHKKRADHLNEILKIQRAVVGNSGNLQIALQTMADKACELLKADGSVVELRDGEDMVYRAASGTGMPFVGMRIKMEGSFTGLCMKRGNVLKCDDSETDDRINRDACRKVGLRSMVVVPLRHNASSIGVLKILSSKANTFSEDDVATLELTMGLLSAALSDAVTADAMRLSNFELSAANITLEKMATTDGLTGLQNRRTFQEFLAREYEMATRYKRPLSMVIMDVDHFKKFNDSFGHPAGDVVLQRVGALLRKLGRRTDCVARYGGEEFVLLLPQTGPDEAMIIATRIQQTVAGETWEHRQVTVSVGVSSLGEPTINSADDLLKTADKALYAAKEGGRNRVVKYGKGN